MNGLTGDAYAHLIAPKQYQRSWGCAGEVFIASSSPPAGLPPACAGAVPRPHALIRVSPTS